MLLKLKIIFQWNVITFLDSKSCSVMPQNWFVKNPGSIVRYRWPKYKVTNKIYDIYNINTKYVKMIGLPYGKKNLLYFNYYIYKIQLLFNLLTR